MTYFLFTLMLSFVVVSCSTPHKFPKVAQSPQAQYNRKNWKHWSDKDGNCLDTRAEILKSRSLRPVTFNSKGCKVKSGEWRDYYYPETLTEASKIDIDHLVPLKHAHDVGAAQWSQVDKEKFANDPENLVVTNKRYNRQKGAKGIDEWLPRHKAYACKYIKDWIKIKKKYHLNLRESEKESIKVASTECVL